MGETLTKTRCVIFGGMLDEIHTEITKELKPTDYIICADKGYEYSLNNGIKADLIIGDFDSAEVPQTTNTEVIVLPTVKDDTDLHFAAKEGLKRGFRDFLISGVTGGRIDHTIASFSTINFLSTNGCRCKIIDKNTCAFIANPFLELKKPDYPCYFSVFPLGENVIVSIKGGNYEVKNKKISNTFPIGVSNEFCSDTVQIIATQGACLVLTVKWDI